MSPRGRPALFLTVLSLSLLACSKRHDLQSVSSYKFTNTLKEQVKLDFYASSNDYNNGGDIISSYQIEAGDTVSISLEALKTYWIDWYSKDYSFHNWGDDLRIGLFARGVPAPKMPVASEDDHLFISNFTRDTSRSIMLNGNGVSSMWKVTIGMEPALKGSHTFIFKKDFSGFYTFTDSVGISAVTLISYSIFNPQGVAKHAGDFGIVIRDSQETEFASMDFHVDGGPFSRGRDSLMVTFSGFGEQYWAERQ